MNHHNNASFWPSYVDIMTTLFIVALVLFVAAFSRFKGREREMQVKVETWENIRNVYSTVNEIDQSPLFDYDSLFLKHLMTIDIQYQQKEFSIHRLAQDVSSPTQANSTREQILEAGRMIRDRIQQLEDGIPDQMKQNIKFLVVIEGQSSRVKFDEGEWRNNYTLSYLRALHLNRFWKDHGIDLDNMPRCELLIAGSGEGGKPRIEVDAEALRQEYPNDDDFKRAYLEQEGRNQRFLVNIVPVIGHIEVDKTPSPASQP